MFKILKPQNLKALNSLNPNQHKLVAGYFLWGFGDWCRVVVVEEEGRLPHWLPCSLGYWGPSPLLLLGRQEQVALGTRWMRRANELRGYCSLLQLRCFFLLCFSHTPTFVVAPWAGLLENKPQTTQNNVHVWHHMCQRVWKPRGRVYWLVLGHSNNQPLELSCITLTW